MTRTPQSSPEQDIRLNSFLILIPGFVTLDAW